MARVRAALPVLVAIVATWWLTSMSAAQAGIPNGVFVQEKAGTTWLIIDGKRVAVPLWPASDVEINAIPRADQWAVMNEAGAIVAGAQPSWCGDWAPCYVRSDPPTVPPEALRRKRIGEPFLLVSLTEATRGYRATITANKMDDVVPSGSAQNRTQSAFRSFDITIRNEGTRVVSISRTDFKLQTVDGFLYDRASSTAHEPLLDIGDLGQGQFMRGWLTFEFPREQIPLSLILQVSGSPQWVITDLSPQG